jgi:hypothetical protein
MVAGIQITQAGAARTRKMRRPNFAVQGGMNVQGLYPYFFTPVLPGETLESHSLKATVVSAPLADPLGGAWFETFLYYVRLTDIDPELSEMFIGQLTSSAGYTAGSDRPRYFTKTGQIDWCYLMAQKIHEWDFRNEGESEVVHPDGVSMLKRINSDVFESTVQVQDGEADGTLAGNSEGEALTPQMEAYLRMRYMGMGIQSYDDYLKTYGLKAAEVPTAAKRPELLAYRRYWSLPSNVVDPATGVPTGAWYWRLDEKNDKAKRFLEPGFIIGLWAVRPKFYDSKIVYPVASSLWGFQDWLPSYSLQDPSAGIKTVDMNSQPWVTEALAGSAEMQFDLRDLHSNGEQFRNGGGRFTPPLTTYRTWSDTATDAQLRGEYVNSADIDAVWLDDATAEGLDYDGICSLEIKGHVVDNT